MLGSAAVAGPQSDGVNGGSPQLDTLRASLRFLRIPHRDVAERAGVSHSLVSRQLAGQAPLEPAVCRAAAELFSDVGVARMRSDRRLRTRSAYHEAGHAVIGHALGESVHGVAIVPYALWRDRDDGTDLCGVALGRASFGPRGERDGWWLRSDLTTAPDCSVSEARAKELCRWGLEDAAVMAAGAVTVATHRRKDEALDGWDYETIRLMFEALWSSVAVEPESLKEPAWNEWLDVVEDFTRDLVLGHWPAIESVAQALLQRETLTGRQFARIVDTHFAQLRAA